MSQIKTTGQLREFLVQMMVGVKSGQIDADRARNITKMAAQVNESFYSEIKTAQTLMAAGKTAAEMGDLAINK